MKKKKIRKLQFKREVVMPLDSVQMDGVAGARPLSNHCQTSIVSCFYTYCNCATTLCG